jgi:hypothetical protein
MSVICRSDPWKRKLEQKMPKLEQEPRTLEALLDKAERKGFVTFDDLSQMVPEPEEDLEALETLLDVLKGRGIPVYEDEEAAGDADPGSIESYDEPDGDGASDEVAITDIPIRDTTGMYFHEMSRVPLLTRQEEVQAGIVPKQPRREGTGPVAAPDPGRDTRPGAPHHG